VGLGDAITCTITNDDDAPSLTLVKTVTNDNGGTALATAWTLTADGALVSPTDLSGTTPVESGATFKADTYALAETNGPSGYTAGSWSCEWDDEEATGVPTMPTASSVTVGLGDAITCTIDNDDDVATPSGETVQSWVLHDSITISGIRSGAEDEDDATVTFFIYSDEECSTLVAAGEDAAIVDGVASTSTGFAVSDTGFYYWVAAYSGDEFNTGFETGCGTEITQIQAKDDKAGGRDDLIIDPA
jgi:hypothetical protein